MAFHPTPEEMEDGVNPLGNQGSAIRPRNPHDSETCDSSPTKKHIPDLHSVAVAEIATQEDWIFDVNCMHCGRSGSFRVDSPEVDW